MNMILKKLMLLSVVSLMVISCKDSAKAEKSAVKKPNIVVIYLDDLGYGDVSAYEAGTLSTPNMDKLANEGIRFTNAYASSATCTPSRYALLTGVYPWRNKDAKILPGTAPLLISTTQQTLPKILRSQGYQTAAIGKWHLGMGTGVTNWNEHITPGANEVGFDSSYLLAATQDRVPTVYIKDGYVDGLDPNDPIEVSYTENFEGEPTALTNPELMTYVKWDHGHNFSVVNGIPRIGFMKGGEAAKWSDVDMADHFLGKVKTFLREKKDKPFFLYYGMQQPHVPRTPHPRFVGKSGMGPRGDVIMEADWVIGEFMKTLKEEGLLEDTMIILSSDNGPILNDGYEDDAVAKIGDHTPWGPLRGGKYSLFEGGVRVPFITYWKGQIQPAVSDALVCQIDLLASLAKLVGTEEKTTDSKDMLDVLMGKSTEGRKSLVIEATTRTALREGDWLMIPPYDGPLVTMPVNIESGNGKEFKLYNLKEDVGQKNNLAISNPEKLKEMIKSFEAIRGKEYSEVEILNLKDNFHEEKSH